MVYLQVRKSDTSTVRQLELAFHAFARTGDGVIYHDELRTGLERMATAPLDEQRVKQLTAELDPDGQGFISLQDFIQWMGKTYTSYLVHPSLGPDRVHEDRSGEVYNPPD